MIFRRYHLRFSPEARGADFLRGVNPTSVWMRGDHCGGQILLGGYSGARALRVSATYGFQPPATLEHLVVAFCCWRDLERSLW